MISTRLYVLHSFKKLHRTRLKVFAGDEKAMTAARLKINEEFSKNKHVTDEESIKAMIKFSEDVERELRTQVIQAREIKPGVFEAQIREDTVKLENIPYDDAAISDDGKMIKFSEDVERELRTQVIQAREIKPGVFEAQIREDTVKLENIPYDDAAISDDGKVTGGPRPCCQDQTQKK